MNAPLAEAVEAYIQEIINDSRALLITHENMLRAVARRAVELMAAGWQEMETAPKDGAVETLLLWVPALHGTGGPVVAHWAHGGGEEQPRFGPAWFWWSGYSFVELTHKPSHWMRLPACPADWRQKSPGVVG